VAQLPIFISTRALCLCAYYYPDNYTFNYKVYVGARNTLYEAKNNGATRERTLVTVN